MVYTNNLLVMNMEALQIRKGDCSLKGATSRWSRSGVWLRPFWNFVFQDRVAEVVKNWRLIFGAHRSDHKSRALAGRLATPIFQNCIRRDISHALCIHCCQCCWGELILYLCFSINCISTCSHVYKIVVAVVLVIDADQGWVLKVMRITRLWLLVTRIVVDENLFFFCDLR